MWPLTRITSRRRRGRTRAELEEFLEHQRPGGSDLDKLTLLIGLVFLRCPDPREVMIARARHRGIRADRIESLLRGDVAFGFRWELIEDMLRECGADSVTVQVAHDLFHDFPRTERHRALAANGRPTVTHPQAPSIEQNVADVWIGQNCSVILTDVVSFSAPSRTDEDRWVIRQVMYRVLKQSCKSAGIPWDECHHEDRGDGVLVVVPPTVPTWRILHPFVARLAEGLSQHNQRAGDGRRFQLRVALDVGPVESDAEGVMGLTIIQTARLVEAPTLKQRLRDSQGSLGFIASDFVYDKFVKHRPGEVDPAKYQKIRSGVKESRFTAWIYLAPD
jgi:hypothetical protein